MEVPHRIDRLQMVAEEALVQWENTKRDQELLHFIMEMLPTPMWVKRVEEVGPARRFRMIRINRAFSLRWGIKHEEYEGKTDEEVWGETAAIEFAKSDMNAVLSSPEIYSCVEQVPDLLVDPVNPPVVDWHVVKRCADLGSERLVIGTAWRSDWHPV